MCTQSHGHLEDTREHDHHLNTRNPICLSYDTSFGPMLVTFACATLFAWVGILIPWDVGKLVTPFQEAREV